MNLKGGAVSDSPLAQPSCVDTATELESEEQLSTRMNAIYTIKKIVAFVALLLLVIFALDAMVTSGLKNLRTTRFGSWNQALQGLVNAKIVVSGSSRAASHYDPEIIREATGQSTFNLGRNGSQTDIELAILETYLEHNAAPEIIVHNLDAFSFVTTREIYDLALYIPYLRERSLYGRLSQIKGDIWKSRYLPMYGYVVEDLNFTWLLGLQSFFHLASGTQNLLGFDPRTTQWTEDFGKFRRSNPKGVSWEIEPAGLTAVEGIIQLCKARGIQLILVYSPEYLEMQEITRNRREIFAEFHSLSSRYQVPFWDYSTWPHSSDTGYFANSQHLNAFGAEQFSNDLAKRLAAHINGEKSQASASGKELGGTQDSSPVPESINK